MTQLDVAKVSARPKSSDGKRRSTNETIKTSDNVRVTITARRDLGEQGLLNALLEAAEIIRLVRKRRPPKKSGCTASRSTIGSRAFFAHSSRHIVHRHHQHHHAAAT